jgi:hypothetical protein
MMKTGEMLPSVELALGMKVLRVIKETLINEIRKTKVAQLLVSWWKLVDNNGV